MGTKKRGAMKSLAAGRPPTTLKPKSMSRKATKALINSHHQLQKKKRQAIVKGDAAAEASIDEEIAATGGLEKYQQASLQGQRSDRGGDSSTVLMQWLEPVVSDLRARPLHMLEVGALSTENACSKSGCFDIERIDLHSQGKGILRQDFFHRPLPGDDTERFDIISLSLVLNYVPNHIDRGSMLIQALEFLHEPGSQATSVPGSHFPSLFLVLPEPCVSNSRYLDHARLSKIMNSLGFEEAESKTTRRLAYYLWKRVAGKPSIIPNYTKKEIRPGRSRNNFAIVLQPL